MNSKPDNITKIGTVLGVLLVLWVLTMIVWGLTVMFFRYVV